MLVEASRVVKLPVDGVVPPIATLLIVVEPPIVPPVIFALLILTVPVPSGVIDILPLASVLVIALPSILMLSIRASVIAEFVPKVTPSIVPPSISAEETVPRLATVAPVKVTLPVAVKPAKAPEEGVAAPIGVPSREPPSMSTLDEAKAPRVVVPVTVISPPTSTSPDVFSC